MNQRKVSSKVWFLLLLFVAFMAGCASNATEIVDITPPTVSVTSPTGGASDVPTNRKIKAGFSEEMDQSTITGSFTVKETVSGNNVPGTVTPFGTSATFTPSNLLTLNLNYTCTIKGGVSGVKDSAGNHMVNDYVFAFKVGAPADITAPTVSITSPTNTAVAVPLNRIINVGFSEEMDPAAISTASFSMKETVSGNNTPGSAVLVGTSLTFTPAILESNTSYTCTIKGGAGGVRDLAENVMVNDFIFTFQTGATRDTTAPVLVLTGASDGDINLPINRSVTATFNEPMDPATLASPATGFTLTEFGSIVPIPGVVTYSGTTATFTPNSNLNPNTRYTSTITTEARDLAGNALATGTRQNPWSWTTSPTAIIDIIAPTVTSTNPVNQAINIAIDKKINATFSEEMNQSTMVTENFKLKETLLGTDVPGTVAYDMQNNIATFSSLNNLKPDTDYTVTVTTGAKDLAGNALVVPAVNGLPTPNPWTFRTALNPAVVPPVANILLTAAQYGTFGGSAGMTNTGTLTQIRGDIGTIATATDTVTGFHDTAGDIYTETPANIGAVNGKIYSCTNSTTGPTSTGTNAVSCAIATQARLDAEAAYLALAAKPTTADPGENLGGLTLPSGVYKTASGKFLIDGSDLTLDAGGDANAVFVFQTSTTLTVGASGAPRSIILINGAQPRNVFWQVGSAATINPGGGGIMAGTIIAQQGVVFSTVGSVNVLTLNGRALSLIASVTLVNTVINVPQ